MFEIESLTPLVRSFAVSIALLALTVIPAHADQRQIQDTLRPEFENKVFAVRRFSADPKLRFDKQGNLLGHPTSGYWSSDSAIQITDFTVDKHSVVIRGHRVIYKFDEDRGKFEPVATKALIQLTAELDPTWQDATPVRLLLDKLLTSDFRQLATSVPDYWHCWLFGDLTRNEKGQWQCTLNGASSARVTGAIKPVEHGNAVQQPKPESINQDGTEVFKIDKINVKAPRALSTPDPAYPPIARSVHLEGVTVLSIVVNKRGEPHVVGIFRPIGAGLDDKAVEAVEKWRFVPGTKNGEPVATSVFVEVNFRLY